MDCSEKPRAIYFTETFFNDQLTGSGTRGDKCSEVTIGLDENGNIFEADESLVTGMDAFLGAPAEEIENPSLANVESIHDEYVDDYSFNLQYDRDQEVVPIGDVETHSASNEYFIGDIRHLPKRICFGLEMPSVVVTAVPMMDPLALGKNWRATFFIEHTTASSCDMTTDSLGRWNSNTIKSTTKQFFFKSSGETSNKNEYDFVVKKTMSKNPDAMPPGTLERRVFKTFNPDGSPVGFAIISYQTSASFTQLCSAAHGNARRKSGMYQKTYKSALEDGRNRREEERPSTIASSAAVNVVLGGDVRSSLSRKQIYNLAREGGKRYGTKGVEQTLFDEIITQMSCERPFVRRYSYCPGDVRVLMGSNCMFDSLAMSCMASEDSIQAFQRFHSYQKFSTIEEAWSTIEERKNAGSFQALSIDMTYNVGQFYLTVVTSRHMKIRSTSGQNSRAAFMGAFFFTSKRDKAAYRWMANALQEVFSDERGHKNKKFYAVCTDGEESLEGIFENALFSPPTTHVLCELHLRRNINWQANKIGYSTAKSMQMCNQLFGTEARNGNHGKSKNLGIIDTLYRSKYEEECVRLLGGVDTSPEGVKFRKYLTMKFEKVWRGYNLDIRLKSGFHFGRVTTNLSENANKVILEALEGYRKKGLHELSHLLRETCREKFSSFALAIIGGSGGDFVCDHSSRGFVQARHAWPKLSDSERQIALRHLGIDYFEIKEIKGVQFPTANKENSVDINRMISKTISMTAGAKSGRVRRLGTHHSALSTNNVVTSISRPLTAASSANVDFISVDSDSEIFEEMEENDSVQVHNNTRKYIASTANDKSGPAQRHETVGVANKPRKCVTSSEPLTAASSANADFISVDSDSEIFEEMEENDSVQVHNNTRKYIASTANDRSGPAQRHETVGVANKPRKCVTSSEPLTAASSANADFISVDSDSEIFEEMEENDSVQVHNNTRKYIASTANDRSGPAQRHETVGVANKPRKCVTSSEPLTASSCGKPILQPLEKAVYALTKSLCRPYHNEKKFIFEFVTSKVKTDEKCATCHLPFTKYAPENVALSHREAILLPTSDPDDSFVWSKKDYKRYIHCRRECLFTRYPYLDCGGHVFDISPSTYKRLTQKHKDFVLSSLEYQIL